MWQIVFIRWELTRLLRELSQTNIFQKRVQSWRGYMDSTVLYYLNSKQWQQRQIWGHNHIVYIFILSIYLHKSDFIAPSIVASPPLLRGVESLCMKGCSTLVQHPWPQISGDGPLASTDVHRGKKSARCTNSGLFDVCGRIVVLFWSALYRMIPPPY